MSVHRLRRPQPIAPANDNPKPPHHLAVVLDLPPDLPVQQIEIEVFAQLLESLAPANDTDEA